MFNGCNSTPSCSFNAFRTVGMSGNVKAVIFGSFNDCSDFFFRKLRSFTTFGNTQNPARCCDFYTIRPFFITLTNRLTTFIYTIHNARKILIIKCIIIRKSIGWVAVTARCGNGSTRSENSWTDYSSFINGIP